GAGCEKSARPHLWEPRRAIGGATRASAPSWHRSAQAGGLRRAAAAFATVGRLRLRRSPEAASVAARENAFRLAARLHDRIRSRRRSSDESARRAAGLHI